MDNEGKVTDLVEQSKIVFLREAIEDFTRTQEQYDLGSEFAKSRRNRTPLVPGVIAAVVLIVGMIAWGVTWYIQQSSRNIKVTISDFTDVNLREVLDAAKHLDTQITDATQKKTLLVNAENNQIANIQTVEAQQIALLQTQDLTAAQSAARAATIRRDAAYQIAAVKDNYSKQIAPIDQTLQVLEAKLSQYDSRQVQEAKKQEQILNSQRAASDLHLQQQKQYYEEQIKTMSAGYSQQLADAKRFQENLVAGLKSKYDPTFTDPSVLALLTSAINQKALADLKLAPYDPQLGADGVLTETQYASLEKQLADYQTIVKQLQSLPYEHSVAQAVNQLQYRNVELVDSMQNVAKGLAGVLTQRNRVIDEKNAQIAQQDQQLALRSAQIAQYNFAMQSLIRSDHENGYVIDPTDSGNIAVYIDKIRQVANGSTGYVFRKDDELIATVRFHVSGNSVSASLVKLSKGKQIEPFDKILIQVTH